MTCNTFDPIGYKYSPKLLTVSDVQTILNQTYPKISLNSTQYERSNKSAIRYARTKLLENLPKGTYPIIDNNVELGLLTVEVIAEFIHWGGYTETQIEEIIEIGEYTPTYQMLEFYLDENFAKRNTGNSCSSIVNKLAQIIGFLSSGAALIEQLRNFSLPGIISQLQNWRNMLQNMVNELSQRLLQQLENFAGQIFQNVAIAQGAISRFVGRVERAREFLSEANLQQIRDRIEEIISRVAGQFEEITPENLIHILMVICQLAESITSFMRAPLDALMNVFNNFASAEQLLTSYTYTNIQGSVQSGFPRMDPRDARSTAERAAAQTNGVSPPSQGGGSSSPVQSFSHARSPYFSQSEMALLDQIRSTGRGNAAGVSITHSQSDPEAWLGVLRNSPVLYVILSRIGTRLGVSSFNVLSAMQGRNLRGSMHPRGKAMDVNVSHLNDNQIIEYIRIASAEGLGGITFYPPPGDNFIHMDTGGTRQWHGVAQYGCGLSPNQAIRQVHLDHVNRRFGNYRTEGFSAVASQEPPTQVPGQPL